jgi:hypothetical protein
MPPALFAQPGGWHTETEFRMQENSMPDWETPAEEDAQAQAEVLLLVLNELPHQLTKLELARQMLGENPGFRERDLFERAVDDLVRVGLLQRCEELILPTRAARHFDSLPMS